MATTSKGSRKKTRGRRKPRSAESQLPKDVLLHWPAHLPFFARIMEGGPGKPGTLIVWTLLFLALGVQGVRLMEKQGITSGGPAMVFLSAFGFLFLLLWFLVKGLLRGRAVLFYLSERGVGIIPSPRQKKVDQWMGFLTWLTFMATFRGGQWSAWRPFTSWKDARRVEYNDAEGEILIKGGNWQIRLSCDPARYGPVKEQVQRRFRVGARC